MVLEEQEVPFQLLLCQIGIETELLARYLLLDSMARNVEHARHLSNSFLEVGPGGDLALEFDLLAGVAQRVFNHLLLFAKVKRSDRSLL